MSDLLRQANSSASAVSSRGGIFLVHLHWECYLDTSSPCFPNISTVRLDSLSKKSGFNFRFATMPMPDASGIERRHLRKMTGIRFFFLSEAIGYKVDVQTIVLQLSSALALTAIATLITDFCLQYAL